MSKNIPHSKDSALELFLKGEEALRAKHAAREESKKGILRVGSAGCMVTEDSCIGACPQTTLARFLGYQLPTEASQAYFDGGIDNESVWEVNLRAANLDLRMEEEIPVKYTLPCGTLITGRPDVVIGKEENGTFNPALMVELKACQATNSAAQKILLEKPDLKHLIQAATYSFMLDVPATLVYTGNVSGGITNFFTSRELGRRDVSFGKAEYKLGWDDGKLYYMKGNNRIDTIVTQQGILDYYSNIARMAREKNPALIYQAMVDIHDDLLPYNPRNYSDIPTMVDDSLPYEEWLEKLAFVCKQDKIIKLKTKNREKHYYIMHPDYEVEGHRYWKVDREITKFDTLEQARRYLYEGSGE